MERASGTDGRASLFFTYHEKADEEHAGRDVWSPISRHVSDQKDREDVLSGARLALEALRLFYHGVADLGDELDAKSGW